MVRLILLVAFVAVAAIAITGLIRTIQDVTAGSVGKDDDMMPAKFRRITYVLLVVLLFGVTSGWLGAA
ncbi:MAG: cell division protein FtsX [Yoonia sp.]|jgi:cell division protein FtsX